MMKFFRVFLAVGLMLLLLLSSAAAGDRLMS